MVAGLKVHEPRIRWKRREKINKLGWKKAKIAYSYEEVPDSSGYFAGQGPNI